MKLAKYKACICEGSAESAIIDILVDNNLLIFTREEMLDEKVIRCRSAKNFEEKYFVNCKNKLHVVVEIKNCASYMSTQIVHY